MMSHVPGAPSRGPKPPEAADVVVIGAGIAGLVAADALAADGLSVVVLEATDRVGGRTRTIASDDGFHSDYGATWLGATQKRIAALADRFGIARIPQWVTGTKRMQAHGIVSSYTGLVPNLSVLGLVETQYRLLSTIDGLARQVPLDDPWACPKATEWDAQTVRSWAVGAVFSSDAVDALELAMRSVLGCTAADMSLLYFLFYVHAAGGIEALLETRGGAQHERLDGGTAQLSQRLAEAVAARPGCRVLLSCPATSVEGWNTDCITVRGSRRGPAVPAGTGDGATRPTASPARRTTCFSCTCRRVIVAAPPSMLPRIAFEPAVPAVRTQLWRRVLMPCMSKFILRYRSPWWRESGVSGEGVRFHPTADNPLVTTFDYCQPRHRPATAGAARATGSGGPSGAGGAAAGAGAGAGSGPDLEHKDLHAALVGFAAADMSLALTRMSKAERRRAVLRSFVTLFGERAADFTEYHEMLWESEEWTGGCPVNVFPAGQFAKFAKVLRAPMGAIHFAGTETATVWVGYMDGAVSSGERAAKEVKERLAQSMPTAATPATPGSTARRRHTSGPSGHGPSPLPGCGERPRSPAGQQRVGADTTGSGTDGHERRVERSASIVDGADGFVSRRVPGAQSAWRNCGAALARLLVTATAALLLLWLLGGVAA